MCKTVSKSRSNETDGNRDTGTSKRRYDASENFYAHLPRLLVFLGNQPWRADFHSTPSVALLWLPVGLGVIAQLHFRALYRGYFLLIVLVDGGCVRSAVGVCDGDIIPAQRRMVGGVVAV